MAKIFFIHPIDKTTDFLSGITNFLFSKYKDYIDLYRLEDNRDSIAKCLELINSCDIDTLIVFLGHGSSNCLCGARIGTASVEHFFIAEEGLAIFRGKNILLLSCRSEEYLNCYSDELGLRFSIGFGDIPTESEEIEHLQRISAEYDNITEHILNEFKEHIVNVIKLSLADIIDNKLTALDLYNRIKLRINKKISIILLENRNEKNRKIALLLYGLKTESKLFGDSKINLFN